MTYTNALNSFQPDHNILQACGSENIHNFPLEKNAIGQSVSSIDNTANEFIRFPDQTRVAVNLVHDLALCHLDDEFRKAPVSEEGQKIKILLGFIAKEVKLAGGEDRELYLAVCEKLSAAKGDSDKERKIEKDLAKLMHKFAPESLKHVESAFREHCRAAWREHHPDYDKNTNDNKIFNDFSLSVKNVLSSSIDTLSQSDQTWVQLCQNSDHFVNDLASLSKTLINYDAKDPGVLPKTQKDWASNPFSAGYPLNISVNGGNVTANGGTSYAYPHQADNLFARYILKSDLGEDNKIMLVKHEMDKYYADPAMQKSVNRVFNAEPLLVSNSTTARIPESPDRNKEVSSTLSVIKQPANNNIPEEAFDEQLSFKAAPTTITSSPYPSSLNPFLDVVDASMHQPLENNIFLHHDDSFQSTISLNQDSSAHDINGSLHPSNPFYQPVDIINNVNSVSLQKLVNNDKGSDRLITTEPGISIFVKGVPKIKHFGRQHLDGEEASREKAMTEAVFKKIVKSKSF